MSRRHEEEVKTLHRKLDLYSDTSLDRFKQNTLVCMCVRVCALVTMVTLAESQQHIFNAATAKMVCWGQICFQQSEGVYKLWEITKA